MTSSPHHEVGCPCLCEPVRHPSAGTQSSPESLGTQRPSWRPNAQAWPVRWLSLHVHLPSVVPHGVTFPHGAMAFPSPLTEDDGVCVQETGRQVLAGHVVSSPL